MTPTSTVARGGAFTKEEIYQCRTLSTVAMAFPGKHMALFPATLNEETPFTAAHPLLTTDKPINVCLRN